MQCQQIKSGLEQLKTIYTELLSLDRKLNAVQQADRQTKERVYRELDHIQAQAKDHIKQIEDVVYYYPTIERAQEILGSDNVLGPKEVEKTFGIHLKKIPKIPFSQAELERAKTLGQMLVLRVDRTDEGQPLSLQAMVDIIQPRWDREGKGKLLYTDNNYQNWKRRTGDDWSLKPPRAGWALVSKELLPESTNKSYIEQTTVIIKVLREQVFKDIPMPQEYTEAIEEFQLNQDRLTQLMGEDLNQATKEFSKLKITQLTRQTIQEAVYDLALYFEVNNKRLLPSFLYTWTASIYPDGDLLYLGYFDSEGMRGGTWMTVHDSEVGVSLSRRL